MIKIAIAGAGGVAGWHAREFSKMRGVQLVAACDVRPKQAKKFAAEHGIPGVYTDFAELLDREEVDAVAVTASDVAHAPLALEAIAAGKHVLCEKPLATCYADAARMARAAQKRGVINMVNLSYRNNSSIHKAAQLVRDGALGRVLHFEASYLQSWLVQDAWGDWHKNPAWLWRLSSRHGSKGVLGDIGVHILDFAGYPIGDFRRVSCRLATFAKAKGNRIGKYVFDANDSAVITAEMKNGAIGTVHTTRWASGHQNSLLLRIYGDKGGLRVDLDKAGDRLEICRGPDLRKAAWKTMRCGKVPNLMQRFIRSIRTGVNEQPDFARGAAVQKVLDACFESDRRQKPVAV